MGYWYACRRLIHDGEEQSPLSTYMFVRRFLEDLSQTPKPAGGQPKKYPKVDGPKWLAPPGGYAKLNADAAVAKTGVGSALGVVCRSETGQFMGASALTLSGDYSPATLEAMACREALALAQDLDLRKICVASDCLEVINNLHQPYFGVYGGVTMEIKGNGRLVLRFGRLQT